VAAVDLTAIAGKALAFANRASEQVAEIVSSPELEARIDRIPTRLSDYGVDAFGFDPQYVKRVIGFGAWVYRHYFRCETFGIDNIPDGRCMIIANHSGQIPVDAAMINMAVFLEREPPRLVRTAIERFVPETPFVSTFMARCGQILGTPENAKRLLDAEEALMVFPEGVRGLNKTWSERYRLQLFGTGFMRLAIETNTPIVPCVVIGAEEQSPSIWASKTLGKLFGIPALPITPTIVPLPAPTRYRIYFGKPMQFTGDPNDEDDVIRAKVENLRTAMQGMVDQGLANREHVFW
jgi:1-acyl-sn-glycerol-3-phosphate acyltransferase